MGWVTGVAAWAVCAELGLRLQYFLLTLKFQDFRNDPTEKKQKQCRRPALFSSGAARWPGSPQRGEAVSAAAPLGALLAPSAHTHS